eukprot:s186_g4.t2
MEKWRNTWNPNSLRRGPRTHMPRVLLRTRKLSALPKNEEMSEDNVASEPCKAEGASSEACEGNAEEEQVPEVAAHCDAAVEETSEDKVAPVSPFQAENAEASQEDAHEDQVLHETAAHSDVVLEESPVKDAEHDKEMSEDMVASEPFQADHTASKEDADEDSQRPEAHPEAQQAEELAAVEDVESCEVQVRVEEVDYEDPNVSDGELLEDDAESAATEAESEDEVASTSAAEDLEDAGAEAEDPETSDSSSKVERHRHKRRRRSSHHGHRRRRRHHSSRGHGTTKGTKRRRDTSRGRRGKRTKTEKEHERYQNVTLFVSSEQWNNVLSRHDHVLLLGAKVQGIEVYANHPDAAVLPVRSRSESPADKPLSIGELFCGGFSGWSHVVHALRSKGLAVHTKWALDRDPCACLAYRRTHRPDCHVQCISEAEAKIDPMHADELPSVLFQTSVNAAWWLAYACLYDVELVCMSAPCPAWSLADLAPGLMRSDGFLIIQAIFYVAMLRPRAFASENVANLKNHRHWKWIQAILDWLHYKIIWHATLDLKEVIPHARDRSLLICIDAFDFEISRSTPVRWPITRKHTLGSYGVVCDLNDFWLERAQLTSEELQLYLDPANLPKEFGRGHAKRTMRDVLSYRLKGLDSVFACILTSYGRPCALSETLVKRGGIYGSLLLIGPEVRKIVPQEIMILLGLVNSQWIPEPDFQTAMILGNAISVPHALICTLNCVGALRESWMFRGIPEFFTDVFSGVIRNTNVQIFAEGGGFIVSKGENGNSGVPATIPMWEFAKVVVKSPLHSFALHLEKGLNLMQVLKKLTAESVPACLEMRIGQRDDVRIPLPNSFCMTNHDVLIQANVPSCLLLSEKDVKACDWDFIAVVHPKGLLVIERKGDFLCVDARTALHNFSDEWDSALYDHVGRKLDDEDTCPNVVWCSKGGKPIDFWELLRTVPRFESMAEAFCASIPVREVHALIHWLDRSGTHDALRSLGWQLMVQLNVDTDDIPKDVVLVQSAGRLAFTPRAISQIMINRIFLNQLRLHDDQFDHETVHVSLKLWDSWVWEADLNPITTTKFIHDAWNLAHEFFEAPVPIRLVASGQQVNPDFSIRHYCKPDDEGKMTLRLHLILQLRGGGPGDARSPSDSYPEAYSFDDLVQMEQEGNLTEKLVQSLLQMDDVLPHLDLSFLRNSAFRRDDVGFSMTGTIATVVRFLRDLNMSGIEQIVQAMGWHAIMHFVDCRGPVIVRLMVLPRPGIRSLSARAVEYFMTSALACKAMPMPTPSVGAIQVKVKWCNTWIVSGKYQPFTLMGEFVQSWNVATGLFGEVTHLRMICSGKQCNPDYSLGEYATKGEDGEWHAKIHLVLQLRGGGGNDMNPQYFVRQKNELAKHMLEAGCSFDDTGIFVEKCIQLAGIPAISQALKPRDVATRTANLTKLASSLRLSMPKLKSIEEQVKKQTAKKVTKVGLSQNHVTAMNFQIQQGFFQNQDGTPCLTCETLEHGATGVALVDPSDAIPWLKQSVSISQDELAMLVLGKCPADSSECKRLEVPAITDQQKPVLLSCCMHQLGKNPVVFKQPEDVSVSIEQSTILALTAFRDEVDDETWQKVVSHPVRSVFEILKGQGYVIETKSPPWGRTWRDAKGVCDPKVSTSLQFHVRIASNKATELLKLSGRAGIYASVKTEDRRTDASYGILWLDSPLPELKVAAASHKDSLGLVKVVRGGGSKISRGIRFKTSDLAEATKLLKPSASLNQPVQVNFTARIAPTPVGATFESVKDLLTQKSWKARPIKPIGADTWLVGFEIKPDESWFSWNGKMVLLSWEPEPKKRFVKTVIAGSLGSFHQSKAPTEQHDDDPWAAWRKNQGIMPSNDAPASSTVVRKCEGPIEQRFSEQDTQIKELKESMAKISERIDQSDAHRVEFSKKVEVQFEHVQTKVKDQMDTMPKHFDATLERALRRQDAQLENSFSELKALIMNKAVPAKKAKIEKPKKSEDGENEDDSMLSDIEQKLIALNITGGFQTNAVKNRWDESVLVKCAFCDETDSRGHRLTSCIATEKIRKEHPNAVHIFAVEKPDWQYLPLTSHSDEYETFQMMIASLRLPDPVGFEGAPCSHHVYYTDGGCMFPDKAACRISSWSVVRDYADSEDHARALTSVAKSRQLACPLLRCLQIGITEGRQTISRGELTAIIMACESAATDDTMQHTDIFTDSQYAVNVIHFLEQTNVLRWGYKVANFDLVLRLSKVWNSSIFRVHKVKSHQDWVSIQHLDDCRKAMGNFVADKMATLSLQRCPKQLLQMANGIQKIKKQEEMCLETTFRYLVDLNKERRRIESEGLGAVPQAASADNSRSLMADSAVQVLQDLHFEPSVVVDIGDFDASLLGGSLQGVNLAWYIIKWAMTLRWPAHDAQFDPTVQPGMSISWGISWFELYINFLLCTSQYLPVRISGSLEHVVFADYFSDEAKIQPSEKRSAVAQCTSFQMAFSCVESLLQKRLIPEYIQKGGKSLQRLGYTGQIATLKSRPLMMRQAETMMVCFQYVQAQPNKKKLRQTLDHVQTYHDITDDSGVAKNKQPVVPRAQREVYVGGLFWTDADKEGIAEAFNSAFEALPDYQKRYSNETRKPVLQVHYPKEIIRKASAGLRGDFAIFVFVEFIDQLLARSALKLTGIRIAQRSVRVCSTMGIEVEGETLDVDPLRHREKIPMRPLEGTTMLLNVWLGGLPMRLCREELAQGSQGPQQFSGPADNRGISTNVAVLVPLALAAFIVLKDALPETTKKVEKDEARVARIIIESQQLMHRKRSGHRSWAKEAESLESQICTAVLALPGITARYPQMERPIVSLRVSECQRYLFVEAATELIASSMVAAKALSLPGGLEATTGWPVAVIDAEERAPPPLAEDGNLCDPSKVGALVQKAIVCEEDFAERLDCEIFMGGTNGLEVEDLWKTLTEMLMGLPSYQKEFPDLLFDFLGLAADRFSFGAALHAVGSSSWRSSLALLAEMQRRTMEKTLGSQWPLALSLLDGSDVSDVVSFNAALGCVAASDAPWRQARRAVLGMESRKLSF